MKKKLIALMAVAILVVSSLSVAASFPDMEDSSWDWARGAVDDMVDYGIIRGYSDNTFRPANSITKGEALVLFSRVVGYTTEGNEAYVELAKEQHEKYVSSLSTPYTGEISYLLYKGILTPDNYLTYAADSVVETPLLRHEAAEFLAKISTGSDTLSGTATQLDFTDSADITSTMAPYIKYVVDNKIMLGMGDGTFLPGGTVTRAQMTVMLSRIIPEIDYEYFNGKVNFYNAATNSLLVTLDDGGEYEIELNDGSLITLDGENVSAENLLAGSTLRVTVSNDILIAIETISPKYDAVINGRYKKLEAIGDDTNGIQIVDPATGLYSTYAISKSVNVTKNDKKIGAAELVKDDFVILTIKDGVVISIDAQDKTSTVTGKVSKISYLPSYSLTVLVNGKNVNYSVAETVDVTRNKKDATLDSILVGDSVTITTTYGVISDIIATSKTSAAEGTISEVIISTTPAITITDTLGNDYTYAVDLDVAITQGDTTKTFYDLRVGDKVKLTLDASTVTKLSVVSSFANGTEPGNTTTFTGVVEYVSTSHGYIKLVDSSALIFISNATLTDSAGKTIALKALTEGSTVTVFGTVKTGSYTASMVVLQK